LLQADHVVATELEPRQLAPEAGHRHDVPARRLAPAAERVVHQDRRPPLKALPRLAIDAVPDAAQVAVAVEKGQPPAREGLARSKPGDSGKEHRRQPKTEREPPEGDPAPRELARAAEPKVRQEPGMPLVELHAHDPAA